MPAEAASGDDDMMAWRLQQAGLAVEVDAAAAAEGVAPSLPSASKMQPSLGFVASTACAEELCTDDERLRPVATAPAPRPQPIEPEAFAEVCAGRRSAPASNHKRPCRVDSLQNDQLTTSRSRVRVRALERDSEPESPSQSQSL